MIIFIITLLEFVFFLNNKKSNKRIVNIQILII